MRYLFWLWIPVLLQTAHAQTVNRIQLSLEQGLPSNETYQVFQDAQGYIWICTDHGVTRYNGQTFESFSTADGLAENTVFRIYEDHRHRLWFLGMEGSLSYWDGTGIRQHPSNAQIRRALNTPFVPSNIAVDSNDVIYFTRGIGGNGYYSVGVADTMVYFHALTSGNFSNTAWLVLNETTDLLLTNLNSFLHQNYWSGWQKTPHSTLQNVPHLSGYLRREYAHHPTQYVLFNKNTVWTYHAATNETTEAVTLDTMILSAYLDHHQQLWVATTSGLLFYGKAPFATTPKSFLTNHQISGIYQDREGSYWVATLDEGVFFISDWNVLHFFKTASSKIQQMTFFKHQLIGVGLKQVYQLNQQYPFEEHIIPIPNQNSLFDVAATQDRLLISNGAIGKLDTNGHLSFTSSFHHYERSSGKTIFWEEKEQRFLVGYSDGLRETIQDSIHHYCKGHWVQSIEKKTNHIWWLGTTQGLLHYNQLTDSTIHLGQRFPLLAQSILALAYFQGYLLVGTKGNGVLVIDPEQLTVVKQWTVADGLGSSFIHCFNVENDSTLWVGTNQGASRLTLQGINIQRALLLNSQNYLPSNGVNDILLQDSSIWLATDKGLAYLPQHLFGNSQRHTPIPMVVQSIQINGHPMPIQSAYTLAHHQQNIVLDFFALSFKATAALSYRYQLRSKHHQAATWNYTKVPQLNFTQLEPGQYTLRIEVSQTQGDWAANGLEVSFYIRPHFTQTWWFALGIMGMVVLIVGVYFRNVLTQNNLEKALAEAEQKALRSQMNPHFLFNAINSVFYFLYKNQKQGALDFLQKFAALMRGTLEHSQHALIPLEQDLNHLQLYLEMEQTRLSSGSPYAHDFRLVVDDGLHLSHWEVPPMLIQPLVENAIVHGLAPKEGDRRLHVRLTAEAAGLAIRVEDNGIGRAAAQALQQQFFIKKTAQGLPLLRQRINTINQLLSINMHLHLEDVSNDPNCSTRCTLHLPHALNTNRHA